jgi:hypothetical protein
VRLREIESRLLTTHLVVGVLRPDGSTFEGAGQEIAEHDEEKHRAHGRAYNDRASIRCRYRPVLVYLAHPNDMEVRDSEANLSALCNTVKAIADDERLTHNGLLARLRDDADCARSPFGIWPPDAGGRQ